MSQVDCYCSAMKTSRRRTQSTGESLDLSWSHAGCHYRVTAWPEVAFERRCGEEWVGATAADGVLAAGAMDLKPAMWERYLEFVPPVERQFLTQFRFHRLEALLVIARCGSLLPLLEETPALTPFVAAHVRLRGTERPAWGEIEAVYARSGAFGLLEWLGLPASRHTLSALGRLADPEIPRRLLASVRTALWHGPLVRRLEAAERVSEVELARECHRIAA